MDEHAFWLAKYAVFPYGGSYTRDAYGIFPRYRLADETLVNIERVAFGEDTVLEEARQILLNAGVNAFNALAKQLRGQKEAVVALQEQLASYQFFIKRYDPLSAEILHLPFRRVLAEEEVTNLWRFLQHHWRIRGAGYGWFPISDDARPVGSLTFHTDLWDARRGDALFQHFLASTDISRCYVLRELGPPDYELDCELANPAYDGSESFLFINAGWIVYVSHESSLTLVGSIAAFFQEQWDDADALAYGGPFSTADLRGTWK